MRLHESAVLKRINRTGRRHSASNQDQRTEFQRDRDRILYSTAFRRLEGITQIVRAGEADVFHNRLTHSIKVAQVGRRLAENLLRKEPKVAETPGLDVEVVEAACLGHDLGHPPFGHIGEQTLDEILTKTDGSGECLDTEGFEGNAQSFRIVTKLAVRFPECDGLDLTRATLAALQKYPWSRDTSPEGKASGRSRKWGYYSSEKEDFEFCMEGVDAEARTLECELMDLADDIAYSVHDLEDFHRCNYIPWSRIFGSDAPDAEKIIKSAAEQWYGKPNDAEGRLRDARRRLSGILGAYRETIMLGPYQGTRLQRIAIRSLTSILTGRYVRGVKFAGVDGDSDTLSLDIDPHHLDEIRILKQIARNYILKSTALAAQQHGQKRIINELFDDFYAEIKSGMPNILPHRFHHLLDYSDLTEARIASDCVSSLTEGEALSLHRRLTGASSGSVLDPIVR